MLTSSRFVINYTRYPPDIRIPQDTDRAVSIRAAQVAEIHRVELGSSLLLSMAFTSKRVPTSKRVRALDLGSMSRSSRSFYSDGSASQIDKFDRGPGGP